jgi:hypothetical protein
LRNPPTNCTVPPSPVPASPSSTSTIIAEETATSGLVEQEIDLSFLTPAREQTSKRRLSEKDETITQLRKKVKLLQQNVRRRDLKLSKMGDLLDQLKKENLINSDIQQVLSTRFNGLALTLMKNEDINMDKHTNRRYNSDILEFAATLNFLSPKAYKFARKHLCLPGKSTLRRHQSVAGNPGWTAESFQALNEHEAKGDCVLVFDAMHLKEQVEFVQVPGGRQAFGYVDLGHGPDESGTLANEALGLVAVGLNKAWRFSLAYFLTRGPLSAEQQHALIKEAILRLHEIGVTVRAIVCDGTAANIATLQNFDGCLLPERPWFQHPKVSSVNIYVTLDASHMVKLARNAFAKGDMKDGDGNIISWSFVSRLFEVQQQEGLRLANRLTVAHVTEWNKRKMRVKLAVQVLSRSVSDALEFLEKVQHGGFADCQPTIKFIRIIDE